MKILGFTVVLVGCCQLVRSPNVDKNCHQNQKLALSLPNIMGEMLDNTVYVPNMMENDIISWSKLSKLMTGREDVIRSNRIQKKYKKQIQELDELITYWKYKHKIG